MSEAIKILIKAPQWIQDLIFLLGVWQLVNIPYKIQLWFGNYLYKNHNKSWLRKIWWSEYDFYRPIDFQKK